MKKAIYLIDANAEFFPSCLIRLVRGGEAVGGVAGPEADAVQGVTCYHCRRSVHHWWLWQHVCIVAQHSLGQLSMNSTLSVIDRPPCFC